MFTRLRHWSLCLHQLNPVHTLTSYSLTITFNIILPICRLGIPRCLFSLCFAINIVQNFHRSHASNMLHPSHPPCFHHCVGIWRRKIMKHIIIQISLPYFLTFSRKSHFSTQTQSIFVLPSGRENEYRTYTVTVLCIWIFRFFFFRTDDEGS
jgi:hypothetical protein